MKSEQIGLGVGQPYTAYIADYSASRVAVRLAKTNPDYEGYHLPFFIHPRDAKNYGDIEVAVYHTGHDDKGGAPYLAPQKKAA